MNRYHKNHTDPDIKKKYEEWEVAHGDYLARAAGFKTYSEMKLAKEKQKSQQKLTDMLKGIGANAAIKASQAIKRGVQNVAKKVRRTGSNRGS